MIALSFVFFFSSRRRHTRCGRDWSSDVCSSDLADRLTAILQRHDTPAVLAVENASRVLYGETHRYGLPEIGTAATLKTLGRADVTRWHRERLRPDLATIIVVGDVTPDDLVRRLDAALAAWKATARPAIKRPPP